MANTKKENSMSDTPIFDQTVETAESDENDAPEPAPVVTPSPELETPPVTPNTEPTPEGWEPHDDEDVDAALGRETEDGPGFGDESQLPAEDFDGFATDDVEVSE